MNKDQSTEYELFLKWFRQNNGLDKKIKFPTKFQSIGYNGISATQQILQDEVFLAVPKSIIISTSTVKSSQLGPIIQSYKFLCDEKSDQTDFNLLVLFLIWEKMKGEKSFYYPYLQILQKAQPILRWSNQDIEKLHDPYISLQFVQYMREEMPKLCQDMNKVVHQHPELFQKQIQWELFFDCYCSVMTRSFGWGLPQTMMVPYADFLNHNSTGVYHYTLNIILEQDKGKYQFQQKYIKKNEQLDLNIFSQQLHTNQMQHDQKQIIESPQNTQKQAHTNQICIQNQASDYPASNSQDNDSEQDQLPNSVVGKHRQFLRSLMKLTKQYVSTLIPNKSPQRNKNIDMEFQESTDFSWWYQMDDKTSYFIVSADCHKNKGEQIYNSYGRRSNRFLLIWYGFAHQNNKYDSIAFRFWHEQVQKKTGRVLLTRYLIQRDWYNHIQIGNDRYSYYYLSDQCRLKRDGLCYQLLTYLRYKVSKKKQPSKDGLDNQNVQYQKIINFDIQKIVLDEYHSILIQLSNIYQIQKPYQKLSTEAKTYFARIFKQSKTQILQNHIQTINVLKYIVPNLKNQQKFNKNVLKQGIQKTLIGNHQAHYNKIVKFAAIYFKMLQKHINSQIKQNN